MELVDVVGWAASAVLITTVSRQVWKQWQDRSTAGVSQWLFVGQMTASLLFLVYSVMVDNLVFAVSNAVLLTTALIGQGLYWRNKRREAKGRAGGDPQRAS